MCAAKPIYWRLGGCDHVPPGGLTCAGVGPEQRWYGLWLFDGGCAQGAAGCGAPARFKPGCQGVTPALRSRKIRPTMIELLRAWNAHE